MEARKGGKKGVWGGGGGGSKEGESIVEPAREEGQHLAPQTNNNNNNNTKIKIFLENPFPTSRAHLPQITLTTYFSSFLSSP